MDGMLSQDEINALLNGMDLSEEDGGGESSASGASAAVIDESLLSEVEKDAIGEIANISMGSSATTLYSLVNRKVNITTPRVTLSNWSNMTGDYEKPCVFIQIRYTSGLEGSNILVLKEHDVKIITDLMMGGDGTNTDGELGEMHLSAISEAMNQMMGSAATSLSTMLGTMIDISPPDASLVDLNAFKSGGDIASFLDGAFVKISFRMQIGDLVDSIIMQLYPVDFAKTLYETFINNQMENSQPASASVSVSEPQQIQNISPQTQNIPPQMAAIGGNGMQQMAMMGMPQVAMPQMQNMNVQPAQFQNFTTDYSGLQSNENIGLIMDVPLEVTVELGRTSKSISEILDFAPGTIIELDKIAGEPIDVLVNGKFVAKGEVVVIEESFGIRVTEIIK
ncbi:flagellar motor switch protein FliN/FliY [Kineothrix alysoides]|uniref:Flagellar motor switch protein FliN/FliY n=1 Tax=Kineothrix alysoides TaxID=1469948 RepID=A0A4V2QBJ1_9FIRM|nr:flagellar motor switch phosphatase FliY [Kineothrix alysoides]TCL56582.1 flagellar motor switch protein FliN/FliY [Kineothrix alysoides]